jgi:hypothetical protein
LVLKPIPLAATLLRAQSDHTKDAKGGKKDGKKGGAKTVGSGLPFFMVATEAFSIGIENCHQPASDLPGPPTSCCKM